MLDETTIRVAIRATARISFVLFLGAFLGDALYRLMPAAATRWLKAHKDGFTLGFAGSHTVHLAFILILAAAIGRENVLKGIMPIPFTVGFLLIYALAAGVLLRHLTFWSLRCEALAHYYLISLFTVSFTRHAIKEPAFYTPFVLVAVTAIVVRIAVAIRSRKQHVLGVGTGYPAQAQKSLQRETFFDPSPNSDAVGRGEVEFVSRLDIERRVPSVEIAHDGDPELVRRCISGEHLLAKRSVTEEFCIPQPLAAGRCSTQLAVEVERWRLRLTLADGENEMRYLTRLFGSLCISAAIGHATEAQQPQPSISEKQQTAKRGTQNPEAYALYLKGRSYWAKRTRSDLETAVSYFNQAIAKDPGYAVAYAGLADCYAMLPDYGASG